MPGGGARANSGRKAKPLADRLRDGDTRHRGAPKRQEFKGVPNAVPKPATYASGEDIQEVFERVKEWLEVRECGQYVSPDMIETYSICVANYVNAEMKLGEEGAVFTDDKGNPKESPWVKISLQYMKQARYVWAELWNIIKANCATDYSPPDEDPMEALLRKKVN